MENSRYKFRAWDKAHKEMIEWEIFKNEATMEWLKDEDLIVMQYTGLKDKNGVEIYEGDIIKTLYNIGVIEWNNKQGRFNVYLNSKGIKNEMNFMKNMADDCQVIGNIYENPEMIKE